MKSASFIAMLMFIGSLSHATPQLQSVPVWVSCDATKAPIDGELKMIVDTKLWNFQCTPSNDSSRGATVTLDPIDIQLVLSTGITYSYDKSSSYISNSGELDLYRGGSSKCDDITLAFSKSGLSALYSQGWRTDYMFRYSFFVKNQYGKESQILLSPTDGMMTPVNGDFGGCSITSK